MTEKVIDAVMGEALGTVDSIFADISGATEFPIFDEIISSFTENFKNFIGESVDSLEDGFDALERAIKENVTNMISSFLDPYIQNLVNRVFELIDIDQVVEITELFSDWLFERISLNKAEVVLTIWEARG